MSDLLKALEALDLHKFEQQVSLSSEKCVNDANLQQNDIIFTVGIPYEHLRSWYDLKQNGKYTKYSYVEILNSYLSKYGIKIKVDCERVNGQLRRRSGETKSKCRKLDGRRRTELGRKFSNISIHRHEVMQISQVEIELNVAKEDADTLSRANDKLKEQCGELTGKIGTIINDKRATEENLKGVQNDYETLLSKNEELKEYIEKMGFPDNLKNTGKSISDVGKRHQSRKLKELKTNVESSLWFAETFGLKLESATLCDDTGTSHALSFLDRTHTNN